MKKCISCLIEKSLNDFSGNKNKKDLYSDKCKICTRVYSKNNRIKNGWIPKTKRSKEEKRKINSLNRKLRIQSDPIFKFKCTTRSLLYNSFNRAINGKYKKSLNTEAMLGCNMNDFLKYIESKFSIGMSFNNYGKWHLDHIKPISKCRTEQDIINYNHYTNLQPLWAKDNIYKSDKY